MEHQNCFKIRFIFFLPSLFRRCTRVLKIQAGIIDRRLEAEVTEHYVHGVMSHFRRLSKSVESSVRLPDTTCFFSLFVSTRKLKNTGESNLRHKKAPVMSNWLREVSSKHKKESDSDNVGNWCAQISNLRLGVTPSHNSDFGFTFVEKNVMFCREKFRNASHF